MKDEQKAFGTRLKTALRQAGLSESPAELIKLLARHGGVPVSPQAISGWLNGNSLPRQANMRALAALLNQLRSEGMGILVVEHDMEFVMNLADRITVLEFGTVIAEGTPKEIQNNQRVLDAYLGGADDLAAGITK